MCRINPRVDFAFKKLFGSEENNDLLISLINAVVSEEDQAADVTLRNPYSLADYQAGKMSILDIKAVDRKGRWYNVEMQISEDLYFDKRAIYYWAKLVTEQLAEGQMYKTLQKTVSICILDFNFVPGDAEFHSLYKIINTASGKDDGLHDLFELHYIELRKFRKDFADLIKPLDRWAAFLSRAHELRRNGLPEAMAADRSILKAIEAVDRMFSEEERLIYETRMRALLDVESKIASAEEKGLEKGLAKGRAEGMAESLLFLLEEKFGPLPEELRAQVRLASAEQLRQWMSRVFTAAAPEELFAG
ncbi:MAG: Rpn family recombination-promoting nuclease/putative transposase [Candidatus Electronema sp. V4]|uniref:Rpn family recombination-promoting nuclease/putative transposase n=1 Tax=Candidatus Electronema sp. V4 TaxID=3454756 RepID=UPI0040553680